MNQELEIRKVPFMGTELMAARDTDGQIWAGVRWMCDGIGLNENQARAERKKIQADKALSKGGSNLTLPTSGGNQQVLCLKLDFVPLWLAKISITPTMEQETPELAEKLMQYQLNAKDVLAAAFLRSKGAAKQTQQLPSLSAVTAAMKLQISVAQAAGMDPAYIQIALAKAYAPYGVDIPANSLPEAERLYECEEIAKELGILSEKGKPHKQAVSVIIGLVGAAEHEKKIVPFSSGSHSGTTTKYTAAVLDRVRGWLESSKYPAVIQGADGKKYRVKYKEG